MSYPLPELRLSCAALGIAGEWEGFLSRTGDDDDLAVCSGRSGALGDLVDGWQAGG